MSYLPCNAWYLKNIGGDLKKNIVYKFSRLKKFSCYKKK